MQAHDPGYLIAQSLNLAECSDNLIALFDGDDRLQFANKAFRDTYFIAENATPKWVDFMRVNYERRRGAIIKHPVFDAWVLGTKSRRGTERYRAFEADIYGGRWLWMTETVETNGWMLCVAFDITSLRADDRSIREARDLAVRASHTDELTGVSNRRYIMERIKDLYRKRDVMSGVGDVLAILDLDDFKLINDRLGHETGDRVLCDFARRFVMDIRLTDCFGRIGGEEFALILPNTSVAVATKIIRRMLLKIAESRPLSEHPGLRYSFSAGVAGALDCQSPDELYRRADEALYSAKNAGRNRVVTASKYALEA